MSAGPAYYNEHDPYAAQWMRNLQAANLITPGLVDERDIRDVRPSDLRGFARAHFFAGIGVWDYALGLAGWPAARGVWTGSCPCQPFSAAGRRGGVDDERHLWPAWFELIRACRPETILGEQVASSAVIGGAGVGSRVPASIPFAAPGEGSDPACQAAGFGEGTGVRPVGSRRRDTGPDRYWRVRADGLAVQSGRRTDVGQPVAGPDAPDGRLRPLEHPSDLPRSEQRDRRLGREQAAGFGAGDPGEETNPFVRTLDCARRELEEAAGGAWLAVVQADLESTGYRLGPADIPAAGVGAPHIRQRLWFVADAGGERRLWEPAQLRRPGPAGRHASDHAETAGRGEAGFVADADGGDGRQGPRQLGRERSAESSEARHFWSDADWIPCRDGKARPVEPGTFPLAHGAPARVGRLRAYGNAINAEAARAFISAVLDCVPDHGGGDVEHLRLTAASVLSVEPEDIFA